MRPLNFRFRSADTSSMTSSSLSVHSWVVIQSLPLNSAFLVSVNGRRSPRSRGDVGEMHVARVADGFEQQLQLEIRQHVERCARARRLLGCQASGRSSLRRISTSRASRLETGAVGRDRASAYTLARDGAVDRVARVPVDVEPVARRRASGRFPGCRKSAASRCCGPPSSGQKMSQLPHSLQASA